MQAPLLDIIIVNYNSFLPLADCLSSIAGQDLPLKDLRIIVFDNASTDITHPLKQRFPFVKYIYNKKNMGFGRAGNKAVKMGCAPFICFLNPDTRVSRASLSQLLDVLKNNPDIGIAAPAIYHSDGTLQVSARKDPSFINSFFGRNSVFRKLIPATNRFLTDTRSDSEAETQYVDWVSGAGLMIKRDLFTQVGGWDNRFFMYWEDVDLSRRVRESGLKVAYIPSAIIQHNASGYSSKANKLKLVRVFHQSAFRYIEKHQVGIKRLFLMPVILGLMVRCAGISAAHFLRSYIHR